MDVNLPPNSGLLAVDGSLVSSAAEGSETFDPALGAAVSALVDDRVRLNVPASSMTTFGIGGVLKAVVTVESVEELRAVLRLLHGEGQRVYVIGFGSNLLIADLGLQGWVVRLGAQFRAVEQSGGAEFVLGGAVSLMSVSRKLSDEGFSGLEFAAGIPASLGGAVFMNAGAHGAEIGSRIASVTGVLPDGSLHEWRGDQLPWMYRFSGLTEGLVVTSAKLKLAAGDRNAIAKACADNLTHRRKTQPLSLPSAGSVFKNPEPNRPAGLILEQAGLKGIAVGGAMVSELHANWIVNPEKRALASDVRALIELCTARVREHSGVVLHPEIKMWS
jgi:UDP-N-acetylmuramate dehydrogenase